ncbi:acyl carrier protein [Nocardia mexicana]|uniref:Acyl carrier protein n=1 Tax=Nocardia mexicana TaxID=279262 RepID=A0A370GP14_9NOCA|nr:acyl carrier protein [Nocardia mexicana]RDI45251.1 acyl carrier protein [Nocardia mexicana]
MNAITTTEIAEGLRSIADRLDLELENVDISATSSLEDDLEMDSLNLMDFLVYLEKRYHVQVTDERLHEVDTIGDVVNLLNDLLASSRDTPQPSRVGSR